MKKLLCLVAFALGSCALDRETGTGSQTGNSIVSGRIATGDTSLPTGTEIHIRPLGWTPSQPTDTTRIRTVKSDAEGRFEFVGVPPGTYRLEAKKAKKGWSRTVKVARDTALALPTGTLAALGRLQCQIRMSDSTRGGRVELYGLDLWDTLPAIGTPQVVASFQEVPVGTQTVRIWSKTMSTVLADIPVRIGPDSASTVEYDGRKVENVGPVEDED